MKDVDGIQLGLEMYQGGKEYAIKQVLEIIDDEQTNLMERLTITADGEADRMFELLERIKERLQEY